MFTLKAPVELKKKKKKKMVQSGFRLGEFKEINIRTMTGDEKIKPSTTMENPLGTSAFLLHCSITATPVQLILMGG